MVIFELVLELIAVFYFRPDVFMQESLTLVRGVSKEGINARMPDEI